MALVITLVVMVLSRATYIRLVQSAEQMLCNLRVKAFTHIHRLSIADHNESKRGELTARVTSDVETIARFAQWGGVAWIVDSVIIVGTLAVMAVYSWQLTIVTVVVMAPLLPILRVLQRRQLQAYDVVRTRVGQTLSAVSESVMGAGVIRAYGITGRVRERVHAAVDRQYGAEVRTARYFAFMFPLGDVFGGVALAAVIGIGVWWGPGWGLEAGTLIAFAFLVNLLLVPIAELAEILDQTQTALAGWRKVLDVLDIPLDISEPQPGVTLPQGPVEVRAEALDFAYRDGGQVLRNVDVDHPGRHLGGGGGPDRVGQDHLRQAAVPSGRPHRGAHHPGRGRPAPGGARLAVRRGAHGPPGRLPVRHHHPRQRAHGPRGGHRRRGGRGLRAPGAGLVAGPAARRASTPRWGSGARTCRWASANWWRWPGPSWPTPGC